jgi:zinc protease
MELREKRSLAYSVYANSVHGLDGGQFVAGIATEPKRATEAYERLQHEIYRLAQTPPSPEELNRNRYMLKGHAAIELQRASERAAEAAIGERLGIHWGFDSYCHALDKVTPEQISAVLCSIIEAGSVIVQVDPKAE